MTVAVYSDGRVAIDGEMTSLDELQPLFRAAAQDQKSVWYYRENPQQEPTGPGAAAVEAVIRSIAENRLPISLSTRPDFSDYVDAQGVAHPRRFGAKQ